MLPEWLVFLVLTFIVPGIAQLIKWYADRKGIEIHRKPITFIAVGLSLIAGFITILPELPVVEDPMEYLGLLITIASAIYGVSTLWYNLILARFFELLLLAPDFQLEAAAGRASDAEQMNNFVG